MRPISQNKKNERRESKKHTLRHTIITFESALFCGTSSIDRFCLLVGLVPRSPACRLVYVITNRGLTPLGPLSRFGDKLLDILVIYMSPKRDCGSKRVEHDRSLPSPFSLVRHP